MKNANQTAIDEGRAQQFDEMMTQLAAMQAKYKGVRGELLAKVREEFEKLKPGATTSEPAKATAPQSKPAAEPVAPPKAIATPAKPVPAANRAAVQAMLPSCRLCGRSMKRADDGSLVCAVGHIRAAA
ncbi:MAG: hypothetical protein ABTQ32_13265 [Myxococcaceae bacterium]